MIKLFLSTSNFSLNASCKNLRTYVLRSSSFCEYAISTKFKEENWFRPSKKWKSPFISTLKRFSFDSALNIFNCNFSSLKHELINHVTSVPKWKLPKLIIRHNIGPILAAKSRLLLLSQCRRLHRSSSGPTV